MNVFKKVALQGLKKNRTRTLWTLLGIMLSTAMITAVFGFGASGMAMVSDYVGDNDYYNNMYNATIAGLGAVFGAIIVFASVVVMSNAFRVSAGERTKQFGILKSIGATKKQIAQSVIFEGLLLSAISVPVGIALGLFVNIIGIQITDSFFTEINKVLNVKIHLDFVIAWQAIIASIILSFTIVWISAWLPAHKAAKTTVIDAIRGAGEVKISEKQARSNWLVKKLFGFEGMLASKSLKRSRRNFRATVISLNISVVLFIVVGGFGMQMNRAIDLFYPGINATSVGGFYSRVQASFIDIDDGNDIKFTDREFEYISASHAETITEKLREYPNTTVFGAGNDYNVYLAAVPSEMLTDKMREILIDYDDNPNRTEQNIPVTLITADAENYAELCRRAGVPLGSNILINHTHESVDGGRAVFAPYIFTGQSLKMTDRYTDEKIDLPLHGVLNGEQIPNEIIFSGFGMITIGQRYIGMVYVVVPQLDSVNYTWFANATDSEGFTTYMSDVLNDFISLGELGHISVVNVESENTAMNNLGQLVMVFVYGFIGLLMLIGLTNIISTISTNIRSRSREFAILQSIGMTKSGLARMINLESILCSAKALLYGIPLGVIGSYVSYYALDMPVETSYKLPLIPILQCVLGVFVITWVVMRYSISRLRGGSIVDTVRSELV